MILFLKLQVKMNLQLPLNSSVNARKEELYIIGCVICLVNDDDFVFASCLKRYGRSEVFRSVSDSIQESSFIGSIDDINIYPQFVTQCFCYGSLSTTSRAC